MRRRKRKKQRKIIIVSMISLLCIMTVGYAAFQTNLNITAKGNIVEKRITPQELKEKYCNTQSGDGLYKDTYEEDRCIYRGSNPNNYITFNDELWRIISIEQDNNLKIIRNEIVKEMKFDDANHRTPEKNTYCTHTYIACGVFAKVTGNFITMNSKFSGTVTEDSSIKEYLNGDYYNNLSDTSKNQIQTHKYNIGAVENLEDQNDKDTLLKNITDEKKYTWEGNIGLANVSDILKASTNQYCTSATEVQATDLCSDSYFFTNSNTMWWLINAYVRDANGENYSYDAWNVVDTDTPMITAHYNPRGVKPVLYLNNKIKLNGKGTKENSYNIILE